MKKLLRNELEKSGVWGHSFALVLNAAPVAKDLRRRGIPSINFDTKNFPGENFRNPRVVSTLLGWLGAGIISAMFLHLP